MACADCLALAAISPYSAPTTPPDPRNTVTARQGLVGVAAVIGICVTTTLVHGAPTVPGTALIAAMAAITWCALAVSDTVIDVAELSVPAATVAL